MELSQKYFDKLDYIQTVSLDMRTAMVNRLKLPPEKVIYIPNFFIPQQLLIPQKSHFKRISVIGSIQKRKNQLDAIKAIELLGDYNVILQIYGNGENSPYGKELQEYIRRRKLTGKVFFKGIATEAEIYENTDIVLLPSLHEGFGYILLECAQYGIPVFAYN